MNYREKRKIACEKLFENFYPDLTDCRKKEEVLKTYELAKEGYYTREIAEILNKSPKSIQKIYRRYNFPNLSNFFPPRLEERCNYKSGTKTDKTGHIYKRVPGHPYGSKHGSYVAVHRLVMEEYLGRYLLPKEVVHHIDGNPVNNNIENLELFSSNSEHLKATLTGVPHNVSVENRKKLSRLCSIKNHYRGLNFDNQPSLFELKNDV